MHKFIVTTAVLLITLVNHAQNLLPAPDASFSNNGHFKISITSSDTIFVVIQSKEAGNETLKNGSLTGINKSYKGGVLRLTATNLSTNPSSNHRADNISCIYSNLYNVTNDTSVALVYSTKIFFWSNKKKQYPALVLPVNLAESLSKKGLEDLLIQHFLIAIIKPAQINF